MSKMKLVTVIMAAFGSRIHPAVLSAVVTHWLQQSLPMEVLVAGLGQEDDIRYRGTVEDVGGRYTRFTGVEGTRDSVAHARNHGINVAATEWVYFTDADVVPLDANYFRALLFGAQSRANDVHVKPPFYRLGRRSHDAFLRALPRGPISVASGTPFTLAEYTGDVLCPSSEGEVRMTEDGVQYVCTLEERRRLDGVLDPLGEDLLMKPSVHWGAVLAPLEMIRAVGGYCQDYHEWGCEDDDLLFKLATRAQIRAINYDKTSWPLVHFEHPRPFVSSLARNESILNSRRARGAETAITSDIEALRLQEAEGKERDT